MSMLSKMLAKMPEPVTTTRVDEESFELVAKTHIPGFNDFEQRTDLGPIYQLFIKRMEKEGLL